MQRRAILGGTGAAFVAIAGNAIVPHAARANESTMARVKARGKLVVGVKYDTPPFGFLGNNNTVGGFDVDMVHGVGKHLALPVQLVQVTSATRIPLLVSGNVDLIAASMTHTRGREKSIDFSITYYTGAQSLLVPSNSTITGPKDLAGKQVAVQQATTLQQNLAQLAPRAQIIAFKDYDTAWLALVQGRADAFTGSLDVLEGFAAGNPKYKIVGEPFSTEPFGLGTRHGDWEMRDEINATLQDLWTSGAYAVAYRTWFKANPKFAIEMWPK